MNLRKIILKGLLLGIILILLFFLIYFFGFNENYFKYNLVVSCFLVPIIILVFLIYELIYLQKIIFQNEITFFTYFKITYLIQLISGICSISFIYLFMNFIDPKSRDVFNYQRANINYQNAKIEILYQNISFRHLNKKQSKKQAKLILNTLKLIRDKNSMNFFSLRDNLFIIFIFSCSIYYMFLSLSLSLFFRKKVIYLLY